jgi:uncharacterized NAD(P)/FAD-binding protein YdhS
MRPDRSAEPAIAVIGGGFAGSIFALKLSLAWPRARIFLIEKSDRLGLGLAYGACSDCHLLNVPVKRMEIGLHPTFASWLARFPAETAEALLESGGNIADAFVPRRLLGRYVEEQIARVMARDDGPGVVHIRGTAIRVLETPARRVRLADGQEIPADLVVMATGNMPPRSPLGEHGWISDTGHFVADPWAPAAFDDLDPASPVLFVGTGLTMIDCAMKLAGQNHRGPMMAVSRHGLLPRVYEIGGKWQPGYFLEAAPPRVFMRRLRSEMEAAEAAGVSWQRVLDAIRPRIPEIWQSWSNDERRQFLRHLRTIWDTHRHRLAPRVAQVVDALRERGQLFLLAGRIRNLRRAGSGIEAGIELRGGARQLPVTVARIINCTGPRADIDGVDLPLIGDLRWRGHLVRDALGLGIETKDSAVIDASGRPSSWLYALGSLTRPALWEITSVAELNAQVERLVNQFVTAACHAGQQLPILAEAV